MRTIKIILAVLILMAFLPASGCMFMHSMTSIGIEEEMEEYPLKNLGSSELLAFPGLLEEVQDVYSSLSWLMIFTFLFGLAAGIIAISWRKKFYGAITSGILVLIPFVWNCSIQNKIKVISAYSLIKRFNGYDSFSNTSLLVFANVFLFLPMALLLIIGTIEIINYFVKRKNGTSETEVPVPDTLSEKNITTSPSNADELKKYKELLDAGVITQEEFDAKKKQLLGL